MPAGLEWVVLSIKGVVRFWVHYDGEIMCRWSRWRVLFFWKLGIFWVERCASFSSKFCKQVCLVRCFWFSIIIAPPPSFLLGGYVYSYLTFFATPLYTHTSSCGHARGQGVMRGCMVLVIACRCCARSGSTRWCRHTCALHSHHSPVSFPFPVFRIMPRQKIQMSGLGEREPRAPLSDVNANERASMWFAFVEWLLPFHSLNRIGKHKRSLVWTYT